MLLDHKVLLPHPAPYTITPYKPHTNLLNQELSQEEERSNPSIVSKMVPACIRHYFACPLKPLPQVYTTLFDKNKMLRLVMRRCMFLI